MPIKAITFDLDDTLWPIIPVIDKANQTIMAWLAVHAPHFVEKFGNDAFDILKHEVLKVQPKLIDNMTQLRMAMLETGLMQAGYQESKGLAQAAFDIYYEKRNQVVFYPDAMGQLQQLSVSYRMGALSNGNADIQQVGLGELFEFCYNAENVGVAKPDAKLFQLAMDNLHLEAHQIIHVGDNPIADIQGAQDMGMHTIWVNLNGQVWPNEQLSATAEINHLSELSGAVAEIGQS